MTAVDDKRWFYLDSKNQQKGPFSEQEILAFYQKGILVAESFIWKNGLESWQSLSSVFPNLGVQSPPVSFDREPAPEREPSPFAKQAPAPQRESQYQRELKGRKLTTKEILFSFEGRLPRKSFWLTTLFIFIAIVLVSTVVAMIAPNITHDNGGVGLEVFLVLMGLPVLVFFVWIGIAMGVKRLHDQNLTGWFYLLSLIPYVGSLILLVMYCIKGTDGSNKYGEDSRHLY